MSVYGSFLFPPFFHPWPVFLSSANLLVCVCVFPVCVSVTPSSTCCVGIHGAGEAGVCGGAAYASTITCSYRSSPPPSLPSKKRPWCSQHLP